MQLKRLIAYLFALQVLAYFMFWIIRLFSRSTLIPDQLLISGLMLIVIILAISKINNLKYFRFDEDLHPKIKPSYLFLICLTSFSIFISSSILTVGNVDRSRSIYLFEWIGCAPKNIKKSLIEQRILTEYGQESLMAFQQRVNENLSRGFLIQNNENIGLTQSGKILFWIARLISDIFNLTGWFQNALWKEKCSK